ncbi:efflux RND transporter periplasmic adaptor subunit [Paenibacillus thermotolerans]|uniref:efflux RND transporter periplasmic adaptor subunit n=1 Tax=Paenibacillus thermotolerans TaxID=3027807 RepID=UPI0023675E5E|nr:MULTISPECIES: efflux RND transporter periplasmic adaptor subunit [unclassified Paenibacillus]
MFNGNANRLAKLTSGALSGMLLAVSLAGCSLLPEEEAALAPPLIKPREDSVTTAAVKKGTIEKYVRGVGTFESTSIAYHSLKEPGATVEEVLVKSGDTVRKGDVLIQFKVGDLDLAIQEDELKLKYAEKNLKDAIFSKDQDMIEIRKIELGIAKTKLEKTKKQLESKQLLAEMDGVVIYIEGLKRNDWVDNGRTLVSVADPSKLRLIYEALNRTALNGVKVGMTAQFDVDGASYTGAVTQTPDSAPTTTNPDLAEKYGRTLYVEPDKLPPNVKMGTLADIRVLTQKRENTLIIPKGALRSYFGRTYVQVLDGETRSEADVEVGIETQTEVEIVNGLKEGQTVILQ